MLLKCTEDVRELLKLVREKTVMSLEEGRMLILHLFTLGEQYILVQVINNISKYQFFIKLNIYTSDVSGNS